MTRTTRKKPTPEEHIEKSIGLLEDIETGYRVQATEVPRDTYALLLFATAGACNIDRVSETKFQINSTKVPGKRFPITDESTFRKSYNQMLKVLEPSPDTRKDFMTSMEKYAETCLSIADAHKKTNGSLPLSVDHTASAKDRNAGEETTSGRAQRSLEYSAGILHEEDAPELSSPKRETSPDTAHQPASPPAPLPPVPENARKIVKVEPFQTKHYQTKEHGVKRDSGLINVVTYDDKTAVFQCAVCNYSNKNRQSLNGHMGRHSQEEREQAKRKLVLHRTEKWLPTPNQKSLITRLAHEIARAMELGLTSPEAIASAIIEARDLDSQSVHESDGPEFVEMTPEQQIEAIRRILGADQAVKEAHDHQEKVIDILQDQIDVMHTEMEQIRKDRENAKKDLADFKDWYNSSPVKN